MEYKPRVVVSTYQVEFGSPRYLLVDDWNYLLMWSDVALEKVAYARFKSLTLFDELVPYRTGYQSLRSDIKPGDLDSFVVGMALDRGLGTPQWGNYLECYGNGRCLGVAGEECRRRS